MSFSAFPARFNLFLYRQHIRRLGPSETEMAREWCLAMIHREHPKMSEEQVERYYDSLLHVRVEAIDEWTRRMS